jgi:hypothetical protein
MFCVFFDVKVVLPVARGYRPLRVKVLTSPCKNQTSELHSFILEGITKKNPKVPGNLTQTGQSFSVILIADLSWLSDPICRSPCHHGKARPQVADREDSLQIWRLPANILNKQLRIADMRWSSILGDGRAG